MVMNLPKPDPQEAGRAPGTPQEQHISDHLANERTFLAWIRTSIAVIGFGFVVAKFSVWLRELSVRFDNQRPAQHSGLSLPLGISIIIFGGVLALAAAWRYRSVKSAILKNQPATAETTLTVIAIIVGCIAAALVIYMVITA